MQHWIPAERKCLRRCDCAAKRIQHEPVLRFRLGMSAWVSQTDEPACVAIEVPEGGFLDPLGERWRCLRGLIKVDDTCQEIVLPANAYFNDATCGTGWKCERGYKASGEACEFINVPENAHLDRSGNRWECNKNFQKSKGLCVLNN